jgi:phospholipid transport system substrate-binding protein
MQRRPSAITTYARRWVIVFAALCCSFFSAASASTIGGTAGGDPSRPEIAVEQAIQRAQQVVIAERELAAKDPDRFYADVDAALAPYIDYEAIAQSVMAENFRRASAGQRARFASTFRSSLVHTYAKAMLPLADYRVRVLPLDKTQPLRDRETVQTEAVNPTTNKHVDVQYSVVRERDGNWRIRNVIVRGINLGLIFRGQFADAMGAVDTPAQIDKVIASWAPRPVTSLERPH